MSSIVANRNEDASTTLSLDRRPSQCYESKLEEIPMSMFSASFPASVNDVCLWPDKFSFRMTLMCVCVSYYFVTLNFTHILIVYAYQFDLFAGPPPASTYNISKSRHFNASNAIVARTVLNGGITN